MKKFRFLWVCIKFCVNGILENEWHSFGSTFAAEKLYELYSIKVSKETVRQVMIKSNLWKAKERKIKHCKRKEKSYVWHDGTA